MITLTTKGKVLAASLTVAVVFGGGFLSGRHSVPTTVTTNNSAVIDQHSNTQAADTHKEATTETKKEVAQAQTVEKKTVKKTVHTHSVKHPDGTVETDKTVQYGSDASSTTNTTQQTDAAKNTQVADTHNQTSAQDTHQETKSQTIVQRERPNVHLEILGGGQLGGVSASWIPQANPFVVGASVEYRVLGPFSVGAFALSNKTIGISIGLDLNL